MPKPINYKMIPEIIITQTTTEKFERDMTSGSDSSSSWNITKPSCDRSATLARARMPSAGSMLQMEGEHAKAHLLLLMEKTDTHISHEKDCTFSTIKSKERATCQDSSLD